MTEPILKHETEDKPQLRVPEDNAGEAVLIDRATPQSGSTWGDIKAAPAEKSPVANNDLPNQQTSSAMPKRSPVRSRFQPHVETPASQDPMTQGKPGLKMLKLFMFAFLAFCSCCIFYLPYLLFGPKAPVEIPVLPNNNKLAIGSLAKARAPLTLEFEKPIPLSGLTVEQIKALRSKYVEKHEQLLATKYEPSILTFAKLRDKLPWVPLRNAGDGPSLEDLNAPSLEGITIANPYLLAFPAWSIEEIWSTTGKATDEELMPLPNKISWDPKQATVEATYDFTNWAKRYAAIGGTAPEKDLQKVLLEDVNAGDMGYNWKQVLVRDAEGQVKDITSKAFSGERVGQYLHARDVLGNTNNLCRFNGPFIDNIQIEPNTDVIVKFWKTKPTLNQPAEATAIWHIR
jgi:hypothetical protein